MMDVPFWSRICNWRGSTDMKGWMLKPHYFKKQTNWSSTTITPSPIRHKTQNHKNTSSSSSCFWTHCKELLWLLLTVSQPSFSWRVPFVSTASCILPRVRNRTCHGRNNLAARNSTRRNTQDARDVAYKIALQHFKRKDKITGKRQPTNTKLENFNKPQQ